MRELYESILNCKSTNLNPTIIYNEGWMVRLLVEYSVQEKIIIDGINFNEINKWTSEALISSPFVDADDCREGYTHADIAFGDFEIDYSERGELKIDSPKLFGVIEAKMKSNLSKGTKNFKEYNQATRNIVCIAHNAKKTDSNLHFLVVAPIVMLDKHQIKKQIEKKEILDQVRARFEVYGEVFKKEKDYQQIVKTINKMKIISISYEEWISKFSSDSIRTKLKDFYDKCLNWNRV